MNPEEEYKKEMSQVLRKIKLQMLRAKELSPLIKIKIDKDDEVIILEKLQDKEGIIKIIEEPLQFLTDFMRNHLEMPTTAALSDLKINTLEYAKTPGDFFLEILPEFDRFYLEHEKTELQANVIPIPLGWSIEETDNKLHIQKNGEILYTFERTWSGRCRYFKLLWQNYGKKIDYKEVYEFEAKMKYPNKDVWKINRTIRTIVSKLKRNLEEADLPIHIETNKGFTLKIAQS